MSNLNVISLDNSKWGPLAWHLIHNFTIKSKSNVDMIIMIKTFGYILPCETCKKHYNYLINDIYILDDNFNKKKIIKYLYEIHNLINSTLEKKNISFKKALEVNEKTENHKFIYLLIIFYSKLPYLTMSFLEFDRIYNFFVSYLKNYPSKSIQNKFKIILESNSFQKAETPLTFRKWFIDEFRKIDFIQESYKKYNKILIKSFK